MPGLSAMVPDISCAPQQSIDVSAAGVPAPAPELPNLVQLLVREALSMTMSAAVLNRLMDRRGFQPFSKACVDVLRSQLGAEELSDLCALDTHQIAGLSGLAPDQTKSLLELCQVLQREGTISSLSRHLRAPAAVPSSSESFSRSLSLSPSSRGSDVLQSFQLQPGNVAAPDSENTQEEVVREEVTSLNSGETLWPQHEAKHNAGKCQPCAYYFKPDSCKWGANCDFCHLCPNGEIKARKKEKIRVLREQAQREKNTKQNPQVVSLSSALNYL